MISRTQWTRQQLLVALYLYCRLPFGQLHHGNPEITRYAEAIGRTPSALAMKLSNIAGIDPAITSSGRKGLSNASSADRAMWAEMHSDWDKFVAESREALDAFDLVPESEIGPTDVDHDIPYRVGEDLQVQATARRGQAFFRAAILTRIHRRTPMDGVRKAEGG